MQSALGKDYAKDSYDYLREIYHSVESSTSGASNRGLLAFLEPVVEHVERNAKRHLATVLVNDTPSFDVGQALKSMALGLQQRLGQIATPTVALELNIARLEDRLRGVTPLDRGVDFSSRVLTARSAMQLFSEYPVLARQVHDAAIQWENASVELIYRLVADWPNLCDVFGIPKQIKRLDVRGEAGDRHRDGRAVNILTLDDEHRIVYKPRSLAVDRHFQDLLIWLNQRASFEERFRSLRVIERGEYGWMEYVKSAACSCEDEVRRFYRRFGRYIAILQFINTTDLHSQNIIAAGEQPIVIDLETVFHPNLGIEPEPYTYEWLLESSVLRTGLLPSRVLIDDIEYFDASGISSRKNGCSTLRAPVWKYYGTDEMRCEEAHVLVPDAENAPRLSEDFVDAKRYRAEVIQAYSETYRWIVAHRSELLAKDGPIEAFACDRIRVVLRATKTYGLLIRASHHPDVMRAELDQDELFKRLAQSEMQRFGTNTCFASELQSLRAGDVPCFSTTPSTTSLWGPNDEIVKGPVEREPSLERVGRNATAMSETSMRLQIQILETAFDVFMEGSSALHDAPAGCEQICDWPDRASLVDMAMQVAERLEKNEIDEISGTWLTLDTKGDKYWQSNITGLDLYSGLAGIALFVGYLWKLTQYRQFERSCRRYTDKLIANISRTNDALSPSAFIGHAGVAWAMMCLSDVLNDRQLKQIAVDIIHKLKPVSGQYDVIYGAAGTILCALSIFEASRDASVLSIAKEYGELLLNGYERQSTGIGWRTLPGRPALAGMSHGAAGIALSLVKLGIMTGCRRYVDAAYDAREYENSLFDKDHDNWLDLREDRPEKTRSEASDTFRWTWCHGAPGIGIAREAWLRYDNCRDIESDLLVAVRSTFARGFGAAHGLCHGDLGNSELLLVTVNRSDAAKRDVAAKIIGTTVASITSGVRCGIGKFTMPGLMDGIAGVGYQLLRIAAQDIVPSVLVLQ